MTHAVRAPWQLPDRNRWEGTVDQWLTETAFQKGWGDIRSVETVKERPWSLVRRLTFEKKTAYFKASSRGGWHEPKLLMLLKEINVTFLPTVWRANFEMGWLLLADEGAPLRDGPVRADTLQAFAALLSDFATLQGVLMARVDDLLAIGVPDRQRQRFLALFDKLINHQILEWGLSTEGLAQIQLQGKRQRPFLETVCAALSPLTSLDHGDLHLGNILHHKGTYRLIDWGDACVTHPFCALVPALEATLASISKADGQKTADYLRDAYLEPWQTVKPSKQLLADFERALWLGQLGRVLSFAHMLQGADEGSLQRWVPVLLKRFLPWLNQSGPPQEERWLNLLLL